MRANTTKIGFKDKVKIFLQDIQKEININKDIPIEEDLVRALIILNFISYRKIADVFLGCSCLNLINSYVKQSSSKLNYLFKRHINNLLKGIEDIQ